MKSLLKLLVIFLMLNSCSHNKRTIYEFTPVNNVVSNISLSQIADDITYIPIDNQIPIKNIIGIELTKESIYLACSEGVLRYSRDGKLINRIGKCGRGPGEYSYWGSFTVDKVNGKVYISDRGDITKIYSKKGFYIREIKNPARLGHISNIGFSDNHIFFFYSFQYGEAQFDWIITDTVGKIFKKKVREIPHFTTNFFTQNHIFRCGNSIAYYNPYNDTVFSISKDLSYRPLLLIGKGNFRLPHSNIDAENNCLASCL